MTDPIEGNALKRKASRSPSVSEVPPVKKEDEDATEGNSNGNAKSPVNEKSEIVNTPAPVGKRVKLGPELPADVCEPTPTQTPAATEFGRKSPEQARRASGSSARVPERNTEPGAARRNMAPDDKGRVKRLFGGALGILSQTQSSPHKKRKQEVDRRQHEKLQKERHDFDKIRVEKLASRTAIRVKEQEKFEEQRMEARHSRMLAMARSLRTRSEPKLYYQPWQLTDEQEDMIDDQIKAAKETIERERREFRRKRGIPDEDHSHSHQEFDPEKHGNLSFKPGTAGERKNSFQDTNRGTLPAHDPSNITKIKDSDDNGEEMVSYKEDTVIY
ncbi:pinin/SDK/memA/ protein conserved region domain containing protein [Rhypophila decipiens]